MMAIHGRAPMKGSIISVCYTSVNGWEREMRRDLEGGREIPPHLNKNIKFHTKTCSRWHIYIMWELNLSLINCNSSCSQLSTIYWLRLLYPLSLTCLVASRKKLYIHIAVQARYVMWTQYILVIYLKEPVIHWPCQLTLFSWAAISPPPCPWCTQQLPWTWPVCSWVCQCQQETIGSVQRSTAHWTSHLRTHKGGGRGERRKKSWKILKRLWINRESLCTTLIIVMNTLKLTLTGL